MKLLQRGLIALVVVLAVGCSSSVNLMQQRHSLDSYDDLAEQKGAIYTEKKALYGQILKATTTRHVAPYPTMATQLKTMQRSINKMNKIQREIDNYKTRFNVYAERKHMVTSEDKPAWAEYKAIRGEYTTLASKMRAQGRSFGSAAKGFDNQMKHYGIEKTSNAELRSEIQSELGELTQGLDEMQKVIDENKIALKFGRKAGVRAELILQKQDVLENMEGLLPSMRLAQKTMEISKGMAMRKLRGNRQYWTGPGMANQMPLIKEFRQSFSQYKKTRKSFDVLSAQFDDIQEPKAEVQGITQTAK